MTYPFTYHDREGLKILFISTFIIYICEIAAYFPGKFMAPITVTAIVRLVQIFLLTLFLYITPDGIRFAGLSKSKLLYGLKIGLIWSCIFGAVIALLYALFFFAGGVNILKLIHSDLPQNRIILFFLTGGLIGPMAEELYFRGIIYSFLRQFGMFKAMIITTLIFALFHFNGHNLPVVQIIGGLIFAASFEYSKSLISPIIIHVTGNVAIFLISLFS